MILKRFKSRIASIRYILTNGKVCHFIQGEYNTGDPDEIQELTALVNGGSDMVYIDENDSEVDTEADPLADMKNKIREEERAKLLADMAVQDKKNTAPTNDRGNTKQEKLNPASTNDIAPNGAAGSTSTNAAPTATPTAAATAKAVPSK